MRRPPILPVLVILLATHPVDAQADFLRGDVDQNGVIGLGDVRLPLLYLWCCQELPCLAAADVDGSGIVDISDAVRILSFLFLGGGRIAPPHPVVGPGGPGDLSCLSYAPTPSPGDEAIHIVAVSWESDEEAPESFDASLAIATDAPGLSAWSVSLAAMGELCQITAASDTEAIAELEAKGLFSGGFHKTELASGDGQRGLVSAVYLSFLEQRALSPDTGLQRILDLRWAPVFPAPKKVCYSCRLRFVDGLQGSGQPVRNHALLDGKEVIPTFKDVELFGCPSFHPGWPPGDCNTDFAVDISDAIFILSFLFLGGREPDHFAPCDANGGQQLELSDSIWILSFLFLDGPPPVEPRFP